MKERMDEDDLQVVQKGLDIAKQDLGHTLKERQIGLAIKVHHGHKPSIMVSDFCFFFSSSHNGHIRLR